MKRMRFILVIIFSLLFSNLFSQNKFNNLEKKKNTDSKKDTLKLDSDGSADQIIDCIDIEDRKDRRKLKKAESYIIKGRTDIRKLYNAFDLINDVESFSSYKSALKTEIFWLREKYFDAEEEGLKVIKECPDAFARVYFFLGSISYYQKDYVAAASYLQSSVDLLLTDPYYSDAIMMLEKAKILSDIISNPVDFKPKIVKGISTRFDEYTAIISPDQEFAFFTRRSLKKTKQDITESSVEEFTFSKKINGIFDVGSVMRYPFNRSDNEGGPSITIDNNILYFTKCIRNTNGYNNCDLYFAKRTVNPNGGYRWSEVQEFPKKISKKDAWDSQPTVSSDGKTIIFASNRKGGYGGIDLYEVTLGIDEQWSDPKNLGSVINSGEDEKAPYLHTDGKTLFFASKNFPSLGGFDIFYSRKDSLGEWQKPVNIGYPINTSSNEISLFVSTDGKTAYFASNKLIGEGGWDIYEFPLHEEAKPERVLFLKGDLIDEDGVFTRDVEIEVKNIKTEEVTIIKVDKGAYVAALTLDNDDDVLMCRPKSLSNFLLFFRLYV